MLLSFRLTGVCPAGEFVLLFVVAHIHVCSPLFMYHRIPAIMVICNPQISVKVGGTRSSHNTWRVSRMVHAGLKWRAMSCYECCAESYHVLQVLSRQLQGTTKWGGVTGRYQGIEAILCYSARCFFPDAVDAELAAYKSETIKAGSRIRQADVLAYWQVCRVVQGMLFRSTRADYGRADRERRTATSVQGCS
jgi:hypothetical protein